jgi:hypothetical protein
MGNNKKSNEPRTSLGLRQSTKNKLDRCRAPGQCYDGFIGQLVDLWEQSGGTKKERVRKAKS